MISLLLVIAIAAYFYTTATPELQESVPNQKLQSKVDATVKLLQHDPQADFDAANRAASPTTNTPPPPGN